MLKHVILLALFFAGTGFAATPIQTPQSYNEACIKAIADGKQLRIFVGCPVERGDWVHWSEPAGWNGLKCGVIVAIPMDDWVYEIERQPRALPVQTQPHFVVPYSQPFIPTRQSLPCRT